MRRVLRRVWNLGINYLLFFILPNTKISGGEQARSEAPSASNYPVD
jgi:hypothetical protein